MKRTNFKTINFIAVSFLVSLLAVSTAQAASFKDNTLIRGKDRQIFVVRQGQREKIKDMVKLRSNFRNQEIINVDDKILAKIKIRSANSGRGSVRSGKRGAVSIKPNNSLIRSRDGKIFVTVQGERRHINNLSDLRREHAGQVIHNVHDDAIREFELRGRANEPNEDVRGNADENEVRGRRGDDADDFVGRVKLRGDGTVDDNSTDSGRNRGPDDSSSSGRDGSSGGSSGSSGGSSDD